MMEMWRIVCAADIWYEYEKCAVIQTEVEMLLKGFPEVVLSLWVTVYDYNYRPKRQLNL